MSLRPKKSLGQHFLHDENIARKIIGYLNPDIQIVLEIGPGKGVLSKYLLEDPRFDPWFVEIDRDAVAYLNACYPAIADRLIEADFLTFDPGSRIPDPGYPVIHRASGIRHPASSLQLVGNFPYNISSQILFRVLEYRHLITEVTGMFQREVAIRIASPPGSKQYGILSVLVQAFYQVRYLFTVSESVFFPPPNVKSAVIKLVRNGTQRLDCNEEAWIRVVKTAFNQRRKTLRNSLRKLAPEGFAGWDDPLFNRRPEQLSVADFVELTRRLSWESGEKA